MRLRFWSFRYRWYLSTQTRPNLRWRTIDSGPSCRHRRAVRRNRDTVFPQIAAAVAMPAPETRSVRISLLVLLMKHGRVAVAVDCQPKWCHARTVTRQIERKSDGQHLSSWQLIPATDTRRGHTRVSPADSILAQSSWERQRLGTVTFSSLGMLISCESRYISKRVAAQQILQTMD
jgi:hypothetical protein